MPKLDVAPTKSNLLALKRQLGFAKEGFDLLEQKRQILIFELMSRLGQAREAEQRMARAMAEAFAALRQNLLETGSAATDRAALAVRTDHGVSLSDQNLMGLRLPRVTFRPAPPAAGFGVGGTSARTDEARRLFADVLPLLARLAELENAVIRLARELRKTQRRCNALSKIFIPDYSATIGYIASSLEERERESFIILRMIKERLAVAREKGGGHD